MATSTPSPGRYAPVAVLAVTLLVFAAVVAYVTSWVRNGLRDQLLQREAEALSEVASLQLTTEADALAQLGVADAPGQLLNAVLKTSKLRGVFAVRVFDAERRFNGALPIPWSDTPPASDDWARLVSGHAIARLHSRETAAEVMGLAPAPVDEREGEPLVETWLPLRRADGSQLAGVAQMWTDGKTLAAEFASLDRRLVTQAMLAWSGGAAIIALLLGWAFRRLAHANRALQSRSEDLARANRELVLTAKTSALGAVAAHLMHELKNPVAGLEEFVAGQSDLASRGEQGGELAAASELTRRLRTMINDVVAVMRDEQSGNQFELTCSEILSLVEAKGRPAASKRGVTLKTSVGSEASLPARCANLSVLVLYNLLQNAIEASAPAKTVRLSAASEAHVVRFTIEDEGAGLAQSVRERLFQPCSSSKVGGSGLGLAISQQLARQAGGRIELVRTGVDGTRFDLLLDRATS